MSLKEKLLKAFSEILDSAIGDVEATKAKVVKSIEVEQRKALFVVLVPEAADAHGDIYSAEEIEKGCANFNLNCSKANLFHRVQTENAIIEQSFISPSDFTLEDGREIKKGTWLQWWYFPETEIGELIWKAVKSGEINGVSVGCTAIPEELV